MEVNYDGDSLKAIVAQQELQCIEQAYRLVSGHARTSTSYRVVSVRECQQCAALDAGTRSQSSSANADFGRDGKQHINQFAIARSRVRGRT